GSGLSWGGRRPPVQGAAAGRVEARERSGRHGAAAGRPYRWAAAGRFEAWERSGCHGAAAGRIWTRATAFAPRVPCLVSAVPGRPFLRCAQDKPVFRPVLLVQPTCAPCTVTPRAELAGWTC